MHSKTYTHMHTLHNGPMWLMLGLSSVMLMFVEPAGIVMMEVAPRSKSMRAKMPDTVRHVELSPLHTPQTSRRKVDSNTSSQPTSCRNNVTQYYLYICNTTKSDKTTFSTTLRSVTLLDLTNQHHAFLHVYII